MADKRTAFKASAQSAQKKKKRTREQEQQTQENRSGTASLSRQTTQTGGTRDINAQRTLEDRRTVTAPKRSSAERTRSTSESRSSNSEWTGGGGANQNPKPHRKQSTATKRARTFKSQQAKENLRQERRDSQQYDPRSGYILRMGLGDDSIESFMQDVEDYANGANSRLGTISPSYDSHSTTYSSLIDSAESLRGRAGNIRAHLNTNRDLYGDEYYDEMMRYLDSVEEFTSGIDRRAKSYEDLVNSGLSQNQFNAELRDRYYRGQFGSSISNPDQSEIERLRNYANTAWEQGDDRAAMEYEDQINWLSENTTGGRMWRYEQNNARIEEITRQLEEIERTYRPGETGVVNASREELQSELISEKKNLETWNRQYERGAERGTDITNFTRNAQDFDEYSHADNYGDPNLDEIEADRAQVYGIADQEGNVYIDDGSFTNMTPVLDNGPSPSPTTLRDFEDPLGAYLSWSDTQKSQYIQQPNTSYGTVTDAGTAGNWDFINDNELAVYYYYLNKGNLTAAQAYLRSLDGTLFERAVTKQAEDIQNASAGELLIRNIMSVPQQVIGGAAAFGGALGNAIRGEGFRTRNSGMWQRAAAQTRAETASRIDEATGNKSLLGISLGDAYQASMSALDSIFGGTFAGKAYTVFMGMGAAAQKAEEAYLSGASDQEIVSTALIAGALEYLSEQIAWDKLVGTPTPTTAKKAVINALEQAGFEGTEEVVSSVGNNIADLLIMGDRSAFETTKRQLLAKNPNMTDSDANFEALKMSLGDLWKDFVGGAISGLGMGGAESFFGAFSGEGYKQYRDAYKQAGLSLENSGATDAVIGTARVTSQEQTNAADKQNARDVSRAQKELSESASRAQALTERARAARDAVQSSNISDSGTASPYLSAVRDYYNQKRAQNLSDRAAVAVGRTVQLTSDTMDALNRADVDNAKDRDVRFFQGLRGVSPAQAAQNAATAQAGAQGLDYIADESKRTLAASDDGRTRNKQTGDEITIDGVADVKNGELLLSTKEGDILPANLITYKNADEALVYETLQRMNVSKASAIALSEAYGAGKISGVEYSLGMQQAYNFGRIGADINKAISLSGSFAANLTDQQRNTAYRMGQIDAQTSFDAQQSAIDTRVANAAKSADVKIGKVIYEFDNSGFRMNEQQRQGVQIAKMVSALTGADVHLYESYERDGKRYYKDASGNEAVAPNGFYSNGSVWIDVNAGNNGQGIVGVTLSHEFTHFIQEWSPEKFKVLGDYVIRRFNESNVNVDELVRAQMEKAKRARGEGLSYDAAYAEVVADSMEQMFTGEKSQALEQLAELKKQDATLWGKIKEWFKRIAKRLNAIRKAYSDVDADNETAAVVRGIDNFVEQASKIFAEGLDDAGKNYMAAGDAAADSAARLSGRKNPAAITEQDVLNLFENALNGEYDDGTYIPVRAHTPEVYIRAVKAFDETSSIKDLPMIMNVRKAIQTMEAGGATYYGNRRPHEIDPFDFAQAIQKMDDPLYIVHQENGRYTEIVSFRGSRPLKTLFVIEFKAKEIDVGYANGYSGGLYNMIVTTYNPDSIQGYLERNEIIYTKKEGVLPRGSGRKMAVALEQAPSTDNIAQENDSVKRYSERETRRNERYLSAVEEGEATQRQINSADEETAQRIIANESGVRYSSRDIDVETLDMLESLDEDELITTYRSMQLIDGKLYPPMAAVVGGSMEDASQIGSWERAVEHPELVKIDNKGRAKFTLNKGKGQGTISAAYNPYMHSSNLMLNDQFTGAYKRPNLVTVECVVPASEMTSGYHAEFAKDATGWHEWHAGPVASNVSEQRNVFLSRWLKPVRIVDNAEVAREYQRLLSGTNASVPYNVVSPGLLVELEKIGVPIDNKGSGKVPPREDIRYSAREDSEGRELTEAQQEYFRDSQVRDADGKLKVVYHGSAAQFTEFSADFMSQHGSSEGQGFYFTDYKPMAQGYEKNGGQLLEGYLDIKKPLSDSDVTLSEAEVKRLIRAIDPTGDDLVLNYDSRGGMGYPSRAWYNRSVEDTLRAVMSTSESDSEILAELANSMGNPGKVLKTTRETLGYDGYIVEGKYDDATVYVAFDSNQFKDVTNLNPTKNADIRYSVRDSAMGDLDDAATYSYENLTSQKDMQVVMLPDVETVRANGRVDNRLVVDAGLENAAREGYTADNGYIFVKNAYTGMEQRITAASIRHGLGGDIKRVLTNARLGSMIGTIVKNAIPVNGLYNTSNVADNTYAMAAYATDSTGHEYVAIVTVEARSNEIRGITAYDVVHSVSGRQKNSSQADTKSQSKNSIKAAVISISDVLEKVNSTYRSVLSDDVLSHFGVERPDGGYYAGRVKFSLRDTSTVDVETVLNENAQLREANEELRKQFKRTVGVQLDQKAIRKMARDLLKQYDSSYSLDTLTDNLSKVFDVVANGGLTWDEASSAVVDMCRKVLEESSSFDTGLYEYDQPVRDYLKNVRLEIGDDMRGGIELVADNGAAYRRGLFGIVGTAKKGSGVSIDQMWSEASEMFPAYFSEDIVNAEDQAERLYYLAQSLKRPNYFTNIYEQNIDAAAYDMMLQIGAKYLDVPQSKTFADKFAEKLEAAREASRDAIRQKAAELRAQQKTANRTQKRLDAKITQTARMLAQTETLADSYKEALQQTEAELHAQQKNANRTEKRLDAKITQLARVMLAAENRANRYQEQLATERETAKQRIRDIRNENAQKRQQLAEEYRQKNKEKLAELRENYSRNKLTRQISDSIKSIRKLFETGRGMANVKQGMRDTVRSTLGAAEVLFSPDVKDSDLILNSQIPVSQDEQALIQRYRTLSRARGNYLDLVDRGIDVDANSKLAAKAQREMLKLNKQLTALGTLERMRDAIFSQRVDSALEAVADAYALLDTSADGYISSAYDQDVADYLRDLKTYLKGQIIANMDNDQLKALRKGVKMVLHTIREQNAAFVSDRRETVEQRSTDTMDEVTVANPDRQTKNTALAGIRKTLGWDNLKPFYAFERMQSPTLMRLFQNVRAGEDVWVVDVNEARDYFQNLARQYGYFDIDGDKRFTFTDKSGNAFELSIPQMMSLYAYSKRAAAMQHLENGGFVFDDNARVTDQKGKTKKNVAYNIKQAHVIDQSIVQDVVSELRKQNAGYLAFVDQMQSYLSKTMGAKGNEVSMKLYGVEMFGEAFYFPIITPGDNGSKPIVVNDTFKIKNSGFTQALNPNAVGTIVLSDFMDVWAKHVNDMAMYHAFTLPLEDMNRVMNYRVRNENGVVTDSVRMRLTNAFTSDAVNYINQFMTDINNGIRSDNRETFVKRMLSGFKKAKVFVNASVVIQQYSAVVRSTDVIDPKYFIGADMQRIGKKWEEVKRFAPIAAVKEMGHFDTGISGSTEEYIKQRSYQGIGENVKAFFTDSAQTEAALSFAPEFADKIAWTQIWSACKRKAADLNPNLSGDALLQKAGEYFTDAIIRTQVYDSTLSKSGLMRSKSAFLNMATAFMAEPTTTLNMLQHSVSDMKRGKPRAALRTIGSVFGSVMLNALLASIVFAGRDDDEDKTYLEKYFAAVTSDFLDGINPLTMAPIVKDAWSLLQGYDVERSDMTLMSDTTSRIKSLVQTLSNLDPKAEGKELEEQNRELRNQAISTATAVANLFGLPFDNIVRDIRALFNTFGNTVPIKDTNGEMIRDSVLSELQNQIPVWNWLNAAESTSDKLYDAIRDGNAEYFARLTRGYEKDSQTNSAIQRALKENEDRITEAAKARMEGRINDYKALVRQMVSEYGLAHAGETTVQDNIVKAINAVIRELENKPSDDSYKPTKQLKMDDYVTAMANGREKDANTARETIIKEMVDYDGKTQDKAEESFVSSAVNAARDRYESGEISEQTAIRIIMDAKDCSKSDARYTMTMWELQRKNPDVSNGRIEKWYNDVKSSGISLAVYNDYAVRMAECKGVDSDGDGKADPNTAKDQKLEVIDSLPISNEQKDFLYRLNNWAESKLYQAPWH